MAKVFLWWNLLLLVVSSVVGFEALGTNIVKKHSKQNDLKFKAIGKRNVLSQSMTTNIANLNMKNNILNSHIPPRRRYKFYKPVPAQLIHKSKSIADGKNILHNFKGKDEIFNHFSKFLGKSQGAPRTQASNVNHIPFSNNILTNSAAKSGRELPGSSTPIISSVRAFVARPGRKAITYLKTKTTGHPNEIRGRALFNKRNLDSHNSLKQNSHSTLTVVPAVLNSFPLPLNRIKSSDISSKTLFAQYSQNSHRNVRQNVIPSASSTNTINLGKSLSSSQLNRLQQEVLQVRPRKLKIIIFSKQPSSNQSTDFWQKIFRLNSLKALSNSGNRFPIYVSKSIYKQLELSGKRQDQLNAGLKLNAV